MKNRIDLKPKKRLEKKLVKNRSDEVERARKLILLAGILSILGAFFSKGNFIGALILYAAGINFLISYNQSKENTKNILIRSGTIFAVLIVVEVVLNPMILMFPTTILIKVVICLLIFIGIKSANQLDALAERGQSYDDI